MRFLHVCLLVIGSQAALYSFSSSSTLVLNPGNFDRQITSNREKLASVVHFYDENDGESHRYVD